MDGIILVLTIQMDGRAMAKGAVMSEEIDIQLELRPEEVSRLLRQVAANSPALVGKLLRSALEQAFEQAIDGPARVRIQIGTPPTTA